MCARNNATARALSLSGEGASRAFAACTPPRALSLSGECAARALATCARRAALVEVGPCPMEAHCASETALSLGARPRSDVPAAASNKQLSCTCAQAITPPRALSLLGGGAARALAACARRAGWTQFLPYGSPLHQRDGPLPRCTAALRRACRGFQQAAFLHMCASNNATARALSLGRRRSTRACGVCAPRWLDSVPALWKPTAPARRPSPSVHGRAPTCQPRLPTSSFLAHVRKK